MKISKSAFALIVGGILTSAGAHDFWLNASNDEVLNIQIGYGHEFPGVEPISQKRVQLFQTPYLLKNGQKFEVEQKGENFNFEGKKVAKGSYIVVGEYKPTFWSQMSDGKWQMQTNRKNGQGVKYCELAKMSAKAVLNVGVADESVVRPIGQTLEIVPLSNPANFAVDEFFGMQVLFEGKPLAGVDVGVISPYLENTHDNEQRAFWGKTDKNGRINIKLFKAGEYAVSVLYKTAYKDSSECDENVYESTFKFSLK